MEELKSLRGKYEELKKNHNFLRHKYIQAVSELKVLQDFLIGGNDYGIQHLPENSFSVGLLKSEPVDINIKVEEEMAVFDQFQ